MCFSFRLYVCATCPVHLSLVNITVLTVREIYIFKFLIYFLSNFGHSADISSLVYF
jgi:hypothetical protein